MPARHLIIGGGTAGLNAIRTIREGRERADEGPGDVKITGIEASLWDEDEADD